MKDQNHDAPKDATPTGEAVREALRKFIRKEVENILKEHNLIPNESSVSTPNPQ